MELKDKLRSLRKQNDLTQTDVAKYLGKTDKSISRYEGGQCKPSYTVIVALSKYFGVPLSYLISEEQSFKETKVQQLLNELIKEGIITDLDSIDKNTESMIVNAFKIDLAFQLNKKRKDEKV